MDFTVLGTDLLTFLATFARTGALLFAMPTIGDRNMPRKVQAAVAAVLAITIAPLRTPIAEADLAVIVAGEILIGLLAGFAGRLVLLGVETGGQLIGVQLGLGFAGVYDPMLGDQALPLRRIAFVLASLSFLAVGGLEAGIRVLTAPYVSATTLLGAALSLIERGGEVLVQAIRLAAPILVAALVANIAVALANRAAPALNVFSVMLAFVLLIGGVTLIATSPAFVGEILGAGRRAVDAMYRMVGR